VADRRLHIPLLLIAALVLSGAGSPPPSFMTNGNGNGDHDLLLYVDCPPAPWNDSRLETELIRTFTRRESVRIEPVAARAAAGPAFPGAVYDVDSLTDWGLEVGGHYLVLVLVDDERLETKKTFHLPLVFHRYQTVGVIEGELRVVDVTRRRLLLAEPFRVEKPGPRVFQATMDDDINDPDLQIAAADKQTFFNQLETELSGRLVKRVGTVVRIR